MNRLSVAVLICLMWVGSAVAGLEINEVKANSAVFENGYILVVGESEGGQTRYKAKRAATVIAQRAMAETVKGLKLFGASTVSQGMLLEDSIQTSVQGFLQGAEVVAEEYVDQGGYARVAMRLNLRGENSLYATLAPTLQDPPSVLKVSALETFVPADQIVELPGQAAYDGLIVLVEGTDFSPALGNRILTEDMKVLFEPSMVSPKMLMDRGCGSFATAEEKAKALLSSWGSTNPMVVKCTKVLQKTEAVISESDASLLFNQNKQTNILPQAKVVFVL